MTMLETAARSASGFAGAGGFEIDRDAEVAAARSRIAGLARFLDSAFRIPGTDVRIGADAALNVVPVFGTLAAKAISGYVVLEARRMDVPAATLMKMAGNVGIDLAISAIPLVGWFGDVFFRANMRNIALLEAHLDARSGIIDGEPVAR